MSFMGSVGSMSSRLSETSHRTTTLTVLCRSDLSEKSGRRLLGAQLFWIPTLPILMLTVMTIVRLAVDSQALSHALESRRYLDHYARYVWAEVSIQKEQTDSLGLFWNRTSIAVLGNAYVATNEAVAGIQKAEEEKHLEQGLREARSWLTEPDSQPALVRALTVYQKVMDDLESFYRKWEFSFNLQSDFHFLFHLMQTLIRIRETHSRCSTLYAIQLLGDNTAGDVADDELAVTIAVLRSLQTSAVMELAVHQPLESLSNLSYYLIQLQCVRTHNFTSPPEEQFSEWASVSNPSWIKDLLDELQSVLEDTMYTVSGESALLSLSLVVQIPILAFVVHNTVLTSKNIAVSVSVFTNKVSELKKEKRKTEMLLKEMLPKSVAKQLLLGSHVHAEQFSEVTVYFSDIQDFNSISALSSPMEMVTFLNDVYSFMDSNIDLYDVYKVETIGCVYMVASGVPLRNGNRHVMEIANMALDVITATETFTIPHIPSRQLQLRIGINTGSQQSVWL